VGCSNNEKTKTAKQNGSGVSIEIGNNENISYLNFTVYVDGLYWSSEEVISEDNRPFTKGKVIWFDTPKFENANVEIELSYDDNISRENPHITNKINITEAKEWVNVLLNEDLELEIS